MVGTRGGKIKQKGAPSFTVQDRKAMLEDLQARDYEDVVTTAIEKLQDRKAFVASTVQPSKRAKPLEIRS